MLLQSKSLLAPSMLLQSKGPFARQATMEYDNQPVSYTRRGVSVARLHGPLHCFALASRFAAAGSIIKTTQELIGKQSALAA